MNVFTTKQFPGVIVKCFQLIIKLNTSLPICNVQLKSKIIERFWWRKRSKIIFVVFLIGRFLFLVSVNLTELLYIIQYYYVNLYTSNQVDYIKINFCGKYITSLSIEDHDFWGYHVLYCTGHYKYCTVGNTVLKKKIT